ncbi:hypothetical protein, partial [uncultured Fibrobacter sp.]|uniref:hypothetical protein n=1 Tax=uncultured Fibrobacter sp. TaxID=261512 RepID=UPI00259A7E6F
GPFFGAVRCFRVFQTRMQKKESLSYFFPTLYSQPSNVNKKNIVKGFLHFFAFMPEIGKIF